MKSKIAFTILLALVAFCMAEGCPVNVLNESFFITGKPRYLETPALHPADDTICPSFKGGNSCCDVNTLADIKAKFELFKKEATVTMEKQLNGLVNSFSNLSKVDFKQLAGEEAGERLRILLEKITHIAKKKFVQLKIDMATCFSSMYKMQAGFLCGGCSINFPVSGSAKPQLIIHSNTLKNIALNCQDFSNNMRDSMDEYHRAKAQIIDYLSAEVGIMDENCTCSGEKMKEDTNVFNISNSGIAPPVPKGRLLGEEISADKMVYDFKQQNEKPRNDSLPNVVNNKSYGPEMEADEILKKDPKNIVNKKELKKNAFGHLKSFVAALYNKISRNTESRKYQNIPNDLKSFIQLNEFTFEEGLELAIKLAKSLKDWKLVFPIVRKMIMKLALGLTRNVPWTLSSPDQIKQQIADGSVPFIPKEPLKLDPKPSPLLPNETKPLPPPPNDTEPAPAPQPLPPKPSPNGTEPVPPPVRSFDYKYNFYQVINDYGQKLGNFANAIGEDNKLTAASYFPYIKDGQVLTILMNAETSISTIISKEAELLVTPNVVVIPVFQIVAELSALLSTLSTKAVEFAENYLGKLQAEDKKFIEMAYFPRKYYRRNQKELQLPTKTQLAKDTIEYFNTNILGEIKKTFTICSHFFMKSKLLNVLAMQLIKAPKAEMGMEAARKFAGKIGEEGIKIMQTCEQNRKSIREKKKCTNDTDCFVCFITREGKIKQINLTAGEDIPNPDKLIEDEKRKAKMFAKIDVSEMDPYDDEQAMQNSRCRRMISARTKLCLPMGIQKQLGLPAFDEPPAVNDAKLGEEFMKKSMSKKKFKEAEDIVLPQDESEVPAEPGARLLAEDDESELEFVEDDTSGLDLSTIEVGVETKTEAGNTDVMPTTSSSLATGYATLLATLVFALLVIF